ncbi:MAG: hypothetical protein RMJ17_02630, partial [Candidatus Aenigmarchaeota archaeon]|nr:hypothetical protein [Candidatus Aenigmarchaeota archaeon]MDW8149465.1 hypothetical protein [Candidatus Aenigmarchaeota archaeon]
INCFFNSTFVSVARETIQKINPLSIIKAISTEEIVNKLESLVSKNDVVVCLDEVDVLEEKALYILSRMKNRFPLILITNKEDFLYKIDGRIRSSLLLDKIYFRDYELIEIKEIIEYRLKKAFLSYEDGISLYLAGFVKKYGSDIRVALKVLQKAARVCEEKGFNVLKLDIVKNVVENEKLVMPRKEILLSYLTPIQKKIMEQIIKGKNTSSQILEALDSKISLRSLQEHLKNLEEIKLIKSVRNGNKVKYEADL